MEYCIPLCPVRGSTSAYYHDRTALEKILTIIVIRFGQSFHTVHSSRVLAEQIADERGCIVEDSTSSSVRGKRHRMTWIKTKKCSILFNIHYTSHIFAVCSFWCPNCLRYLMSHFFDWSKRAVPKVIYETATGAAAPRVCRYAFRCWFTSVSAPLFNGVHLGSSLKSRMA